MKKSLLLGLIVGLILSVAFGAYAQLSPGGGGGGGLTPVALCHISGDVWDFCDSNDALGDSSNPIANGYFTALTAVTMTISGTVAGNLNITDDNMLQLGTTLDEVLLNQSTLLAADAEVTAVIEGTSEHPGVAANSLLVSNITNDGDILLLVSKAGSSQGVFWADGSTGDTAIMAASGQSVDTYIAGTKEIDYATGAMAFQQATTISTTATTLTLSPATDVHIPDAKGLVIGHTAQITALGAVTEMQMLGTSSPDSLFTVARFSNDALGSGVIFGKSRGLTVGSFTIVQVNDTLGNIIFATADGGDFANYSADIVAAVDGTPGVDDVPGRLVFGTTATGGTSTTERLRITSAGVVILGLGEGGTTAATGNTFRAPDMIGGTTVDAAGADLTIAAGLGTGDGDAGQLIFQLPDINGASNSTLQSRASRLVMDMAGSTTDLTFAFQQATTISTTTGNLTLSAVAGADVLIGDDATILYVDGGTGTVGIGKAAITESVLDIYRDFGEPNTSIIGVQSDIRAAETTAATANRIDGVLNTIRIAGTGDSVVNTQNWTAAVGLRAVQGLIVTQAGSSGAVTGAAAFYARNATVSGATITNQYGLYIENLTAGGSDYGIYIAGADTYALWVDAGTSRFDGTIQSHDGTNPVHIIPTTGEVVFNETSADIDFRIESNGNANMFVVDGGVNGIGIGQAAGAGSVLVAGWDNATMAAGTTAARHINIQGNITELANATITDIVGAYFNTFTITDGGGTETVGTVATVYINNAPTVGTAPSNGPYALFVDAGTSRFDGAIAFGGETVDIGTSTVGLNDLHFGSGGIINFDGSDVTITHAANQLTIAGGDIQLDADLDFVGSQSITTTAGDLNITLAAGGNVIIGDGAIAITIEDVGTLGIAATTFAVDSNIVTVAGDGGGNTVATITGGVSGQILTILFSDSLITITDTDAHTANTVDLSAAFTSADDTTLMLMFDGTSWYQVSRSNN